jgi:hypothetical protein
LTGFGLRVPHRKSYVIDRDKLLAIVDRDELGVGKDYELPEMVILLPAADDEDDAIASEHPRLLFHAQVHRELKTLTLSDADIRARIHRIGQAAFDEIRTVVRQERLLLPPRDDRTVYEEFVAVYLEFKRFAPELLAVWFPAVDDWSDVDVVVAQDVDAFGITPPSFPLPTGREKQPPQRRTDSGSARSEGGVAGGRSARLQDAEYAAAKGNNVRAALELARGHQPDQAAVELQHLIKRLQSALEMTADQAETLKDVCPALLANSQDATWPSELRLLFDLQNICLDFERPVASPDLAEWVISSFRQPFVRQLPFQPFVQAIKHLRRAIGRLANVRIEASLHHELAHFLETALLEAESRLRDKLRTTLHGALTSVGLRPGNYPEKIALNKVVEELLDNIVARGYLRIGDLRDAISRNQLKLPDLTGKREWFNGDPLLRANRELAMCVPGIYRRGEIYLRWLQRLTAALFGTVTGRLLTLHLLLPFGGAFLAVEGPYQIVHEIKGIISGIVRFFTGGEHVHHHSPFPLASWSMIIGCGVLFWLLLHVGDVRQLFLQILSLFGRVLRALLIDAPMALMRWPALRAMVFSTPCRWFWQLVFKPAVPAILVWWALSEDGIDPNATTVTTAVIFVAVLLFANSRLGRDAEDATADWLARRCRLIRDVVPGLFRLIVAAFKQLMEWLDRGLYAVDEWLRFRTGESRLTLIWKSVVGTIWSTFAYVVRFVLVLFVEPQVNPIKHFPVVTISHKLLLPMIPALAGWFMDRYGWDKKEAGLIAGLLIGKIPGVFGFLVWEFKENWRLYAANRPATLRPVVVGHHGETVPRLLRPGLHSGTIPKLFAKLRRAEKKHDQKRLQRFHDGLHHNEEAVRHLVERELAAYLNMCPTWPYGPVMVPTIHVATNRIRIELACPRTGDDRAVLTLEEQSGWLLAGILDPGWTTEITAEAGKILWLASKGFCKSAGVDLLFEQVDEALSGMPFDVADGKLLAWPDKGFTTEIWYDLNEWPVMHPRPAVHAKGLPTLDANEVEFRRRPIGWLKWVAQWDEAARD